MSGLLFLLLRLICKVRGHRGDKLGLAHVRRSGRDHWAHCARCGGKWFLVCTDPELSVRITANTAPIRRDLERMRDAVLAFGYALGHSIEPPAELERRKMEYVRKYGDGRVQ